jgi:aryl-alcohol dehydrogenase-like predicted oxidoreductase
MASRLALGTVQFGIPYGISNASGQVSRETATAILFDAGNAGLDTLDTASAYGESEAVLGAIGVSGWRVFTKLPPLADDGGDLGGWAIAHIETSMKRLGTDRLAGVMLHRSGDLERPGGAAIFEALRGLKSDGVIGGIGYSIYHPAELDRLFGTFRPDVVQAPFNVFDRRLATSGWLERLSDAGVEIHTRSAFLQGLLLMQERPAGFERWRDHFAAWDAFHAGDPLAAALGFPLSFPEIDRVVIGVTAPHELAEILAAAENPPLDYPEALAMEDEDLINPANWNCA